MGFRFICYKSLWDFERFLWNLKIICDFEGLLWDLAQQFSHEYIREHKSCSHDFVNEYIHAQSATL